MIVVKGLDNPFFEAINQGCQKWNRENASSPYSCFYTGPASTSDEAGEAQIVQALAEAAPRLGLGVVGPERGGQPISLDVAAGAQRPVVGTRHLHCPTRRHLAGDDIADIVCDAVVRGLGDVQHTQGRPGHDRDPNWRRVLASA